MKTNISIESKFLASHEEEEEDDEETTHTNVFPFLVFGSRCRRQVVT